MSISQDQAIEALNAQRNSQIYRMLLDERDQSYDDIPEVPASPAVEAQANEVLQHIDRAVRAIPTDEAEVQDFVDSMDAIQPVVSDVNDTELPPVTEGRHRYNLEEAVARLSSRRERSEMQEEAERQRINNETPNTDSARRVTSEERIAAVASNIRDELTNIARDVVGEMDTPSLRQTLVRRIGDLQTRYQEVLNSTDNNNATTWLSTRGTISQSTDASYQYTVNGQPFEADMNSMYTTASSIPKIDFAEYMKSPDRITIRTISDYIDELRKLILEKRIMVADVSETRSTYPSSTTAVLLESERALTFLRQKVATLDLAQDLLTNPNDRKEFIDDISQGCSLFFRLFVEWENERSKDFYSAEEEADIGRILALYLDMVDDSYLSLSNHFIDGFREQIKDAAWQTCRTLMGSRSPLTNRYNELLEHKKIALAVSTVEYSTSRRVPMTEHLMCKIVRNSTKLSAKYTKEDSQRIFRALMRDIDNSRRKLNSGIMETLRPRIKDFLKQAAKDRRHGSIIDFEALLNDKMKIDVYIKPYTTEYDKDAFSLTIEIEQKSLSCGNLIKSFADRKQVLRFLETEMIKPYSKFNRERCEELLNGLRANFRCVTDSPFHEVFALIKNLTPLASFSELRPTFSYVKSEVFDYPFTVIIRSDELKVIRFLKTIYSMVDSIDPGSSDFVLEQVNNGEGYWVVAVPVEFMIKFLGYTRFAKFLNDRRETEINALMAALAYENTFEGKHSPIAGYWDNESYVSDEHLGYRLHRFSKKGVDDFRPRFVHSIEWGKDVTDCLQYEDWREWDRASEWDRIQRFERILKDFIQTSFKNSIIPSPADEGFLHVFMKTLLWNQHTLIQTLPFRFDSDTVYKVFKDRLSEVIEDRMDENCTKLEITKKLKEVIEKKHLIFHPVVDSMRKFIAALSVNSGSDFFDPSAIG